MDNLDVRLLSVLNEAQGKAPTRLIFDPSIPLVRYQS